MTSGWPAACAVMWTASINGKTRRCTCTPITAGVRTMPPKALRTPTPRPPFCSWTCLLPMAQAGCVQNSWTWTPVNSTPTPTAGCASNTAPVASAYGKKTRTVCCIRGATTTRNRRVAPRWPPAGKMTHGTSTSAAPQTPLMCPTGWGVWPTVTKSVRWAGP